MIVVVAGQARKAGKTQAVCDIIAGTREARWVAIKITPHQHTSTIPGNTDTERYLAAGAAEAHLASLAGLPEFPPGANLIIESNSILGTALQPDVIIFLRDPSNPDWKATATAAAGRADFTVDKVITREVLSAIRTRLASLSVSLNT